MDKTKNLTIEEKIELMKEDYNNEWWRPSKIDNFELRNKLMRVGCRPMKRKFSKCFSNLEYSKKDYIKCLDVKKELDNCYQALYLIYINTKRGKE